MKTTTRTPEQLRHHYEIEKELANRLRAATREDRRKLYGVVYDELYARVTDHPLLQRKTLSSDEARDHVAIKTQIRFLKRFLTPGATFLEVGAGSGLTSLQVATIV